VSVTTPALNFLPVQNLDNQEIFIGNAFENPEKIGIKKVNEKYPLSSLILATDTATRGKK
jgi:hypothetical protein